MKVEQNYTIDGVVVELIEEFAGVKVFESGEDDELMLYFVKNNNVCQRLKISADCAQNMGFVSECKFIGV